MYLTIDAYAIILIAKQVQIIPDNMFSSFTAYTRIGPLNTNKIQSYFSILEYE